MLYSNPKYNKYGFNIYVLYLLITGWYGYFMTSVPLGVGEKGAIFRWPGQIRGLIAWLASCKLYLYFNFEFNNSIRKKIPYMLSLLMANGYHYTI